MSTFDHALELVSTLPREAQNELEEILRKRRIDARREEIAANGREAIRAFHAGELKNEIFEELIERLHSSLDDDSDEDNDKDEA